MKSKVLQRKMFRDPSEDENVGIMQGFMDSLEEMLTGEGDMSEEEDDSPSGAPDRTPRSPEILMNTMRGDMRSVDARVEELADMVGYNAASSTPLEVLALLQPVLKQQGIAALPTSSAMPPSPAMAPPPSTSVPPVPTQGGGIATLPQGDMGQGPPPMPMQMADGGVVQHFQAGAYVQPFRAGAVNPIDLEALPAPTDEDSASYFPNDLIQLGIGRRETFLNRTPERVPPLQEKMDEYAPIYRTLMGEDGESAKAQLLFALSQRALNYAGNVNDQGQALRGSQGARLAGAFSSMPAAVGALAADKQKQDRAINLAALEAGQRDIDSIRAANAKQGSEQTQAWLDIAKGKPTDVGGLPTAGLTPAQQLKLFSQYGEAYGKGETSPEMTRAIEASMTDYTQRRETIDELGRKVLISPVLPPFMVEFTAQRQALLGRDAVPTTLSAAGSGQGTLSAAPVTARTDFSRPFVPSSPIDNGVDVVYTDSLQATNMHNAGAGAGLIPGVSAWMGQAPLVGPWLSVQLGNKTEDEIAKRNFLQSQSSAIINAFQFNPRFPEGERVQIQKDINTLPGLWNNEEAYKKRLAEIDSALENRMSYQLSVYNDASNADVVRQGAREMVNTMHFARTTLGVPPRINNEKDPRLAMMPEGSPMLYQGEQSFMPVRLTGPEDPRIQSLPNGTPVYYQGLGFGRIQRPNGGQ